MANKDGDGRPIRGSMTALVTPLRDGEVDWSCWERLIERQIAAGTDWLVALGTTGEAPTLSQAERDKMLERTVSQADGRCPVMIGTGTNNTAETIERTRRAEDAGADAALVVAPCYNRPTREGLFRHFAAVAESVGFPIVLYDVPARTGVEIHPDVVVRLRERFANVVAVKDATGRVENVSELTARCDIAVLCGDDTLTWPCLSLGAVGVISVIANLCPALMKSLVAAAADGDMPKGLSVHRKVYDLAAGIGRFGPNPLPIKTAMAIAGLLREEFRLPLCPPDSEARAGIECILRRHEIPGQEPHE